MCVHYLHERLTLVTYGKSSCMEVVLIPAAEVA